MVKINLDLIKKIENKEKANREEIMSQKKNIKDFLLDDDIRKALEIILKDDKDNSEIIKMEDMYKFYDNYVRKFEVLYSIEEEDGSIIVAFQTHKIEYNEKPIDEENFIEKNRYSFKKETSCTINTSLELSKKDDSGVVPLVAQKEYINLINELINEYDKSIINAEFNLILEKIYKNI